MAIGMKIEMNFDEIKNYSFDKATYPIREICDIFSIPYKTFKTWQQRGELNYPIVLKLDGSRRIVVQPKLFSHWLCEKKFNHVPTLSENLKYYDKQIRAMKKARGHIHV
jgi:hypothetical protein|tara:strand:+ start:650 stop:976 length:327 start_codon:yes stop_codon:yes gene_type:complete